MNCQDCREVLSARIDQEAASGEVPAVEEHLVACADCRRFQDDLDALGSVLREWTDEALPYRARRYPPSRATPAPLRPVLAWGMISALIVVAGIGYLAGRASSAPPTIQPPRSGSDRIAQKTVYPSKNEHHLALDLERMDASRARLR